MGRNFCHDEKCSTTKIFVTDIFTGQKVPRKFSTVKIFVPTKIPIPDFFVGRSFG